jgi:thioester reductase-like protein
MTVIHSAWAVNFNLGVRSFEQQHIKGTFNLLNLCLSVSTAHPARLFFCSSISAAAGTPLPATIKEQHIEDLSHAQNMGYARSKLVTEHIIKAVAEKTGMCARVLRIGQIVGDSKLGKWNTTEAIPLMIRSAVTIKALPALDETPSWMPVDQVAQSIIELSGLLHDTTTPSLSDSTIVYQVQNTRLFHWTHDLLPALRAAGLDFKIVSQREWVRRLRESDQDPVKNPTIKLLDFFVEKYGHEGLGRSGLVFETRETERESWTMKEGYDVIGSGLVGRILREWTEVW